MIKRYVLGFAFNIARSHVLLTRKLHPEWQAGKLNGIGGHLEAVDFNPGSNDANIIVTASGRAMHREGVEEAQLENTRWELYALMTGAHSEKYGAAWECYVFRAFDTSLGTRIAWDGVKNDVGEELTLQPILGVHTENSGVIENLRFLIPLALQRDIDALYPIELRYKA